MAKAFNSFDPSNFSFYLVRRCKGCVTATEVDRRDAVLNRKYSLILNSLVVQYIWLSASVDEQDKEAAFQAASAIRVNLSCC